MLLTFFHYIFIIKVWKSTSTKFDKDSLIFKAYQTFKRKGLQQNIKKDTLKRLFWLCTLQFNYEANNECIFDITVNMPESQQHTVIFQKLQSIASAKSRCYHDSDTFTMIPNISLVQFHHPMNS
jgi:hypothetical protein